MSQVKSTFGSLLDDEGEQQSPKRGSAKSGAAAPGSGLFTRDRLMLAGSVLGLVAAAVLLAMRLFGGPISAEEMSRRVDMICSETGEHFPRMNAAVDLQMPYKNPKTGRLTLYPAEKCYWNKDGSVRLDPTWILLNAYVDKPGPTTCPDCGRPVTGYNAKPPIEMLIEAGKQAGVKK